MSRCRSCCARTRFPICVEPLSRSTSCSSIRRSPRDYLLPPLRCSKSGAGSRPTPSFTWKVPRAGRVRHCRRLAGAEGEAGRRGRVSSLRPNLRAGQPRLRSETPRHVPRHVRSDHERPHRISCAARPASSTASSSRSRRIPTRPRSSSLDQRVDLARRVLGDLPNVEVVGYSGLTVEFARKHGLSVVVRGLRAVSDFEFEFQLANMSRHLAREIETVFLDSAGAVHFYFLFTHPRDRGARRRDEGVRPSHRRCGAEEAETRLSVREVNR